MSSVASLQRSASQTVLWHFWPKASTFPDGFLTPTNFSWAWNLNSPPSYLMVTFWQFPSGSSRRKDLPPWAALSSRAAAANWLSATFLPSDSQPARPPRRIAAAVASFVKENVMFISSSCDMSHIG